MQHVGSHSHPNFPAPPPCPARSCIFSGDDAGVVCQWGSGAVVVQSGAASGPLARFDNGGGVPVTCLGLVGAGAAAVVGYADGRLRVYLARAGGAGSGGGGGGGGGAVGGGLELEVCAHVGALMALSMHPRLPSFATAGQDGVVNVWSFPELQQAAAGSGGGSAAGGGGGALKTVGKLALDMASKLSSSVMLTGLSFVPPPGSTGQQYHLLVAAYDCSSMRIFLGI